MIASSRFEAQPRAGPAMLATVDLLRSRHHGLKHHAHARKHHARKHHARAYGVGRIHTRPTPRLRPADDQALMFVSRTVAEQAALPRLRTAT